MPQLMPLFWNLSIFMYLFLVLILVIFYFKKMLEFDLIYSSGLDKAITNNSLLMLYLW